MLQGPVINHRRANKGESQAEVDAADWSHVIIGRLIPVWTSKTSKCPSRQTVRNLRYEEIQRDLLGHVTEQGGHSWPLLLNERCARYIAPITPPPLPQSFSFSGLKRTKACWYWSRAACLPARVRVRAGTHALAPVFIQFNPVAVYQRGWAARMVEVKTRSVWLPRHLFCWCSL